MHGHMHTCTHARTHTRTHAHTHTHTHTHTHAHTHIEAMLSSKRQFVTSISVIFCDFQEMLKQELTGLSKSERHLPLSVAVRTPSEETVRGDPFPHTNAVFHQPGVAYCVVIWMYTHLSGLITLREDGTILGCNDTFISLLFGHDKNELQNKVRK